jgi:hypothetical protein
MRKNDLLNRSQYISLSNVLRTFESDLRQVDAWLQGNEECGILYRRKLTLSSKQRKAARDRIAAALQLITDLADTLDLQIIEEDLANMIRSQMSMSWANLLDTQSGKLRRFGDVDPRLSKTVDPVLLQLADLAEEIALIFDGQSQRPEADVGKKS